MHRWGSRFAVGLLAVVCCLASTASPVAAAAPARGSFPPVFEVSSKPFAWDGWTWRLTAVTFAGALDLTMSATTTLDSGSHPLEGHTWRFDLPLDDLTTDHADLAPTRLDTGTDLGSYGAIDVSLQKDTKLVSRSVTCPATGAALARVRSRTGTFSGLFDFKPGAGFPTDVAPISFRGTISKTTQTYKTCRSGGGGGGCPVGKTFLAFTRRGEIYADKTPERSTISFYAGESDGTTHLTTSHEMIATVPITALAISPEAAVVHSKPFGAWASGSLTITLAVKHVANLSKTCIRMRYEATSQTGAITVHFATGDVDYATPFKRGVTVTITKRI